MHYFDSKDLEDLSKIYRLNLINSIMNVVILFWFLFFLSIYCYFFRQEKQPQNQKIPIDEREVNL